MSDFFNDDLLVDTRLPSVEELRARSGAPDGYEGCAIVRIGKHLAWKKFEELQDDDIVSFYDGDCRNVLKPDDPRLKA